jgi:hypothetical protein
MICSACVAGSHVTCRNLYSEQYDGLNEPVLLERTQETKTWCDCQHKLDEPSDADKDVSMNIDTTGE